VVSLHTILKIKIPLSSKLAEEIKSFKSKNEIPTEEKSLN